MAETEETVEIIEAAGGLVWHENRSEKKLAVVHRTRHGDEWTLPKGKLKKNEKWIEAARREVCEEIGCESEKLRIASFAGGISYLAKGKPKVVLFWNMVLSADYQPKKTDSEVDQVKWLSVSEALDLLAHPKERDLVRENCCLERYSMKKSNEWGSRFRGFFQSASYQRLSAELGPFAVLLNTLKELKPEENKWTKNAEQNLKAVEEAMERHEIHRAWNHFHDAVCASVYLLDEEDGSLGNIASSTLIEAKEKLDRWRREAVIALLCDEKRKLKEVDSSNESKSAVKKGSLRKNDVYTALKILTGEYGNNHIKLNVAHKQLELLVFLAIILVPSAVIALAKCPTQLEIGNLFLLTAIVLFGAIGGVASGMMTISRRSTKGRIPDQLLSSWSTMSKPIFGAVSALGVSLFLFAGLLTIGGVGSVGLSIYVVLTVSFLAGFSERFLLSVLRDNDIASTQKEIVAKLDEVAFQLKSVDQSEKPETSKPNASETPVAEEKKYGNKT